MATDDAAPEYPRAASSRRPDEPWPTEAEKRAWGSEWVDAETEHARDPAYRRGREYQEITSLLAAVRAANFDLGDTKNRDAERLLTAMLRDWRDRYERRQRRWLIAGKAGKWVIMAVGGALVTLFGPDVHTWLKSHYWP